MTRANIMRFLPQVGEASGGPTSVPSEGRAARSAWCQRSCRRPIVPNGPWPQSENDCGKTWHMIIYRIYDIWIMISDICWSMLIYVSNVFVMLIYVDMCCKFVRRCRNMWEDDSEVRLRRWRKWTWPAPRGLHRGFTSPRRVARTCPWQGPRHLRRCRQGWRQETSLKNIFEKHLWSIPNRS